MAASLGKGHALWAFQRRVVDPCSFEATREGAQSLAVQLVGVVNHPEYGRRKTSKAARTLVNYITKKNAAGASALEFQCLATKSKAFYGIS